VLWSVCNTQIALKIAIIFLNGGNYHYRTPVKMNVEEYYFESGGEIRECSEENFRNLDLSTNQFAICAIIKETWDLGTLCATEKSK
jgi:hypothetical protein